MHYLALHNFAVWALNRIVYRLGNDIVVVAFLARSVECCSSGQSVRLRLNYFDTLKSFQSYFSGRLRSDNRFIITQGIISYRVHDNIWRPTYFYWTVIYEIAAPYPRPVVRTLRAHEYYTILYMCGTYYYIRYSFYHPNNRPWL